MSYYYTKFLSWNRTISSTKISLVNKIENTISQQRGFRSKYSTNDHIQAIREEYRTSLAITFIDFEESFDRVETSAVMEVLEAQGVERPYIEKLKDIQKDNCTGRETGVEDQ